MTAAKPKKPELVGENGPEIVKLPTGSKVAKQASQPDRRKGVWVSFYSDSNGLSTVVPHASEIAALRHAIGGINSVKFVPFGTAVEDVE